MITDTDPLLPFLIVSIRSIYGVVVTLDLLPEISLKYTTVINSDANGRFWWTFPFLAEPL
jgi:hypothetical protein